MLHPLLGINDSDQHDVGHRAEIPEVHHACKLGCLNTFKADCAAKTCLDKFLSSLREMSTTEADLQIFNLMKGLETAGSPALWLQKQYPPETRMNFAHHGELITHGRVLD